MNKIDARFKSTLDCTILLHVAKVSTDLGFWHIFITRSDTVVRYNYCRNTLNRLSSHNTQGDIL